MEKLTVSFTQADLDDWLNCDRAAGRRVWFASGLFDNMRYYAAGRALERFGYHTLQQQLVHFAISTRAKAEEEEEEEPEELLADDFKETTSSAKLHQKSNLVEALNEMAGDVVLAYHDWLKANKTPADFAAAGVGGFLNYTKISLEHRMFDRLTAELRFIPREEVTTGRPPEREDELRLGGRVAPKDLGSQPARPGQADSPLIRLLGDSAIDPESILIFREFLSRCTRIIQDLLAAFRQSPELAKTPSLVQRLELLSQLPESEPWEALAFLTDNHRHLEYKKFAQEQLEDKFNQNNWNSYNRRLKQKWLEFLSAYPEQDQVAELQECIRCLMKAM